MTYSLLLLALGQGDLLLEDLLLIHELLLQSGNPNLQLETPTRVSQY